MFAITSDLAANLYTRVALSNVLAYKFGAKSIIMVTKIFTQKFEGVNQRHW